MDEALDEDDRCPRDDPQESVRDQHGDDHIGEHVVVLRLAGARVSPGRPSLRAMFGGSRPRLRGSRNAWRPLQEYR
jgi:hypothetical protein